MSLSVHSRAAAKNANDCAEKINVPDLTAFFARGGKAILYTGWSDELISPGDSVSSMLPSSINADATHVPQIKWHADVTAYTRAHSNLDADEHIKLFMVPGMTHCAVSEAPHTETVSLPCYHQYGPSAWSFGANEHRFRAPHLHNESRYDGTSLSLSLCKNSY